MRFTAAAFSLFALAAAAPSPAPIAAPVAAPAAIANAAPMAAAAADAGLLDGLLGPTVGIDILGLIEVRVDLNVNLLVFIGVELDLISSAENDCHACSFVTTQNICIALELCPGSIPDYSANTNGGGYGGGNGGDNGNGSGNGGGNNGGGNGLSQIAPVNVDNSNNNGY